MLTYLQPNLTVLPGRAGQTGEKPELCREIEPIAKSMEDGQRDMKQASVPEKNMRLQDRGGEQQLCIDSSMGTHGRMAYNSTQGRTAYSDSY